MRARVLPCEEWPRLKGTLLEGVWPQFHPQMTRVLVVEQDGQIVGCSSFVSAWHVEGTWIHPDHRKKAAVGRRLWLAARRLCEALGVREVLMMTTNSDTASMCQRLGKATALECAHFAVVLEP